MPALPHVQTLPAHMADVLADSPAFNATRGNFTLILPEPIQPLLEIRASGFDAIVQMTDKVMLAALNRSLGTSLTSNAPIPTDLDATLTNELADRVAAERVEAEVIAWPPAPGGRVVVDLEPSELQTRIELSAIQVSQRTDPTVSLRFSVALNIIATETAASYEARVDRESFNRAPPPFRGLVPVDSGPVSTTIALSLVILVVSGPVRMEIDRSRFALDAYLDFTSAEVSSIGSSEWGSTARDLTMPLVRRWGHRTITPPIRLFGDPPSSPIPEATRFDVAVVGLPSNQRGSLLSFCIETAGGTAAPDLAQVGAFTGSGNFAFFATEPVIKGIVLSRWRSLPQRELEWTVPMIIERGGTRLEASARVRYEIGDAHWAAMDYGTEHMSDNILVYANFISQAMSARLGGRDISSELGDRANPRTSQEFFRLFPNYSPVQQEIEAIENWLLGVGRHVLPPLHRPVSTSWGLRGDFEAQVSTPLFAMVTRGMLI